jgi:eukaryotic-like serine/threonine-protein kinase
MEPPPPPPHDPTDPTLRREPPHYPPAAVEETVEVPPPPPPAPPPPRPFWPWLLGLLILVLAGLLLLWLLSRNDNNKPATATVPSVVGLPQQAATGRLRAAGFNVQIRLVPSRRPKGVVISQAPQAGAILSRGSTVALSVSGGPPKTGVPDVVGLRAAEAVSKLDAAGLKVEQKTVASSKPAGTVVAQRPAAGEQAARGTTVVLEVSKGPQRVAVPDVAGEKAADAGSTWWLRTRPPGRRRRRARRCA